VLPPAVAIPILKVSSYLGLPPTATYAALELWNFTALSADDDLIIENLKMTHTFTGTPDEAWFYLISVSMEARGGHLIPIMLEAMNAVRANQPEVLRECLAKFSEAIDEVATLLNRMYDHCKPNVFYHEIRPFLAGSKNMLAAGLPNGVFYGEGNGKGRWHQYSGGSNAQSTLIQLFDVVLGVEHSPTKSSRDAEVDPKAKNGFLQVSPS